MPADLAWVLGELESLAGHGLEPVLFGGWAKELLGAWPPWRHEDLDVLVRAPTIDRLGAYIAARGAEPCAAKRHPHKRAYQLDGTLVELFLVLTEHGTPVTHFYGRYRREWPEPLSRPLLVGGRTVEVATPATIIAYEGDHHRVQDALYAIHPGLQEEFIRRYGERYVPLRRPFAGDQRPCQA